MKKIIIISHKLSKGKEMIVCKNGDLYDSEISVRDETGKILWEGICNVDSTNNLRHKVEIIDGEYKGIVGLHKGKYKAILIYQSDRKIINWQTLTDKERTLITKEPNPRQGGSCIARYINIHKGGDEWDWSEGCITIYYSLYNDFINLFELNEVVSIEKA